MTSTVPAACAGEAASDQGGRADDVNDVAADGAESTALAPVNPVPVMVTAVPPVRGPATGLTALTVGTAW